MHAIVNRIEKILYEHTPALRKIPEEVFAAKPAPGKWSKKEILGHLIDSAQNNLRRFVVAQYEENPRITYQQDDWVRINHYQQSNLEDLIQMWYLINRQIVTILHHTKNGERICDTGELHSIQWLASDYIKHLRHHLHQLLDLDEVPYP